VAEKAYEQHLLDRADRLVRNTMLYDSREAPPDTDMSDEDSLINGLKVAYADSTSFVNVDRLVSEVWDPSLSESDARRFYLNQIYASTDAWIDPHLVDSISDHNRDIARKTTIALGFDGSKNNDATALVGYTLESRELFEIKVWEKPDGPAGDGWEVPREEVDATVHWVFANFDVVAFYSDVHPWQSYIDSWADTYRDKLVVKAAGARHAIGFDMRSREGDFTKAAESFMEAATERNITLVGETLSRHFKNTRSKFNRWGESFRKESRESQRKIDAAAAAVLAFAAGTAALQSGAYDKRPKRTGRVMGWS